MNAAAASAVIFIALALIIVAAIASTQFGDSDD
jgi:hypothetical protein